MRRRTLRPAPPRTGRDPRPPPAAAPPPSRAHALVLLLSAGILVWASLCVHIHVSLSVEPTPLGSRLRARFADRARSRAVGVSGDDGRGHLAACLLVNDENPRLPEWIAYHYLVGPLRSLTVAVDPASRSSPAAILGRWRDLAGMEVQIWDEGKYMPRGVGYGPCDGSDPGVSLRAWRRCRQAFGDVRRGGI